MRPFILLLLLLALRAASAASGAPLSLAEAQALAIREAPVLAAQRAALASAERQRPAAGELPDPKLVLAVENLPAEGADRFSLTRDFMTMRRIGLMQDFPREEKRRLRTDRADIEIAKESALLALARVNLRRDVALAWIETWFAQQQLATLRTLSAEAELQTTAAQAAVAGGKGATSEAIGARLGQAQLADRITEAERNVARARAMLARWIGVAAQRPLDSPPDFSRGSQQESPLASVDHHPQLAMYVPLQSLAETEVKLAEAAKRPDWSLEVAYQQRGSAYSNMLSIGVRIDLPILEGRRQDPAIASKLALVEQTRAQAEDARRVHVAEITARSADWDAARERVRRYEASLLPLAREREQAALAAYRGGRGELSAVVEARKGVVEMRLASWQAQAEMARAWAQLSSLLPDAADKDKP